MASRRPFSTAGMYSFGTTPPTIALTNSKSTPSSAGSNRICTTPNWPLPPDCFLCLPSASALERIVSRYGIRGSDSTASTLDLFFSLLHTTSMCISPRPWISTSPVSAFFSMRMVGSSSRMRFRPEMTLSSSPCFLAVTARLMHGAGNSIGAKRTGLAASHSVSPVAVYCSLPSAPMSPALSLSSAMVFLPRMRYGALGFSDFSALAL